MFGKVKSLQELFEIELCYAYDCEKKLADKGLPTMIENAKSTELRAALGEHLRQTHAQITRLERVFSAIGAEAKTKSNAILGEIMDAAKDSVSNIESSSLRDAALIINGNQVEHYEIALYGSLEAFAEALGFTEVAALLEQTLQEEKAADARLTEIAETVMNERAARHQTV
jgi:ferritin-like metal-binding protein YciE